MRSKRAGKGVIESVSRFVTSKLKLKVNSEKSAVERPSQRKFRGYSFTDEASARIKIAPKSLKRFKERVRELTNRNRGVSLNQIVDDLSEYIRGWMGYYRYCQTPSVPKELDSWIRRRIRCYVWKQWKTFPNRIKELLSRGVPRETAYKSAFRQGLWAVSKSKARNIALDNFHLKQLGLVPLTSFVKV